MLQWTGIPVSVGIAPTKTLAKLANRTAKKAPESGGLVALKYGEDWIGLLTDDVADLREDGSAG